MSISSSDHSETDVRHTTDTIVFNCYKHVRFIIAASGEHRILNAEGEMFKLEHINGEFISIVKSSHKTYKVYNANTGEFVQIMYNENVRYLRLFIFFLYL